nr:MAG TPA: hypothetical protein [Caudoviricetes sp.]
MIYVLVSLDTVRYRKRTVSDFIVTNIFYNF